MWLPQADNEPKLRPQVRQDGLPDLSKVIISPPVI